MSEYRASLEAMDRSGLYSNFGPLERQLEKEILARQFQGEGALTTVANATLGLMLAIAALQRRRGGWALMPSFTFAATPLAAMWCGLRPYFLDIDPRDWTLSAQHLSAALERFGEDVAVVVPYATFGCPMDLEPYARLHHDGFPVVVDAAPGMGVEASGRQFGAGFPGAVVFSLHATKPFGIGEGGLVYSADPALVARVRADSNFGFDSSRAAVTPGLNAKLSEPAAAIGLAVQRSLGARTQARRQLARVYMDQLADRGMLAAGWSVQEPGPSCPQFVSVLCPSGRPNQTYVAALAREGIECRTYFCPACHAQPAFAAAGRGELACTEDTSARVLSLPFPEGMGTEEVSAVLGALQQCDRDAVR
ncbi:MAG: DegT/DnrJ/EryC1/StrS family aminotransferase [Terriglobales bacterium]